MTAFDGASKSRFHAPAISNWDWDNGPTRFFKFKDAGVRDRLIESIRHGNHQYVACRVAGVSDQTYRWWRYLAQESRKQNLENEFTRFFDEIDLAGFQSETLLIETTYMHALQNPEVALRFMGKKWPDRWADTRAEQRMEISEGKITIFLPDNSRGDRRDDTELDGPVPVPGMTGAVLLPPKRDLDESGALSSREGGTPDE